MQKIIWPWTTSQWVEIKPKISDKITSIVDMDTRISSICGSSLRPRLISELFAQIDYAQDHFINDILPMMQNLIISAPKTFRGFDARLLTGAGNLSLNRKQVATILACMWFCLFNYNYVSRGKVLIDDCPEPTFINIFIDQNVFALNCLLNYFARVHEIVDNDEFCGGCIIIKRNTQPATTWLSINEPICAVDVAACEIDESPAKLHVVFAHEYLGGDRPFGKTLSQEEVTMLIRPELIPIMLFCPKLASDSVIVFGAEKMSLYTGLGANIRYAGDFRDKAPKGYNKDETEVMLQHADIFIDASNKTSVASAFIREFERDLNKAFCGFNIHGANTVATGNWAYAFNGANKQLKFIQQLLAASAAKKTLIYHSPNKEFRDTVGVFKDWLDMYNITVAELFVKYTEVVRVQYLDSSLSDDDLFVSIMEHNMN